MYDALIVDDEPLARQRIRDLLGTHPEFAVAGECGNGEAAVAAAAAHAPDIIFLDVQMPDFDGFDVAEALLGIFDADRMPLIVFVTAHDRYALQAFEAAALDYVVKPVGRARFDRTLDRLRHVAASRRRTTGGDEQAGASDGRVGKMLEQMTSGRPAMDRFAVRRGDAVVFVSADEIDWADAAENYVRLHARGTTHMLRSTMNGFMKRLDGRRFLRIHRSAIVNLARVAKVRASDHGEFIVTMSDGARLVASRTYSGRLRAELRVAGGRR
jgi:two-component system, LytTR family, response regulator